MIYIFFNKNFIFNTTVELAARPKLLNMYFKINKNYILEIEYTK